MTPAIEWLEAQPITPPDRFRRASEFGNPWNGVLYNFKEVSHTAYYSATEDMDAYEDDAMWEWTDSYQTDNLEDKHFPEWLIPIIRQEEKGGEGK